MAKNTVIVSVLSDAKKFGKGLNSASAASSKFGKGLKIAGGVAAAGVAALTAAVGTSVKAAMGFEQIEAKTEAAIKSTGGAAGKSVDDIEALAVSLSKMSGVSDEVIQASENMMLRFQNIKGDTFDRATESALDFSAAVGIDMTRASRLVGKALNDPAKGLTRLERYGISFTESEQERIKAMTEAGRVEEAQAVILDKLGDAYGGTAAKIGQTAEGAVKRSKDAFGRLQVTLGSAFLPVVANVFGKIADWLDGINESAAFTGFVDGLGKFIEGLTSGESGLGEFVGTAGKVAGALSPVGIILKALEPVLPVLTGAVKSLAQAFGGALAKVLPSITKLSQALVDALSGVLAEVLPVIVDLVSQLATTFGDLLPAIAPIIALLGGTVADILTELAPIIGKLAGTLGDILGTALEALTPLLTMLADTLGVILEAALPVLTDAIVPLVDAFLQLLDPLLQLIEPLLTPLIDLLTALLEPILGLIAPLLDLLVPALDAVSKAIQFVVDLVGGILKVLKVFIGWVTGEFTLQDAAAAFLAMDGPIGDFARWIADLVQKLANFVQSVKDKFGQFKKAVSSKISSVISYITGLPRKILNAVAGFGTLLYEAGTNLLSGLINGIKSWASRAISAVTDIGKNIVNGVKNFFGIHSPSRVMYKLGSFLTQGFANALGNTRNVVAATKKLSKAVTGNFDPTLGEPTVGGIAQRRRTRLERIYNVTVQAVAPNHEVGRAVTEAIAEYESMNGARVA